MKSQQQSRNGHEILASIAKIAPIYLMRTPKGKRLLQTPHTTEVMNKKISATEQPDIGDTQKIELPYLNK